MKIGIVGCGWLGLPLAESLVKAGHEVVGSTTREEKLETLSLKGIEPILFHLNPMPEGLNFNRLFQVDLLIINIPPGRKKNTPEFYEEQIKYLKYQLLSSDVKKVIFISSTSYYPNSNKKVTVNTPFDFRNGSTKAVVKGEQQISQIDQSLMILRCGGLMGKDRIPGKWFAGKPTKGADTPVNYIHLEDIIKVVKSSIETWPEDLKRQTLNLVSDIIQREKRFTEKWLRDTVLIFPYGKTHLIFHQKWLKVALRISGLKSPLDY